MNELNVKGATIAGAAVGAAHALFGLAYLGAPTPMIGFSQSMMYNMMAYQPGTLSATGWVFGSVLSIIVFGIVGYIIAVAYNFGAKK